MYTIYSKYLVVELVAKKSNSKNVYYIIINTQDFIEKNVSRETLYYGKKNKMCYN